VKARVRRYYQATTEDYLKYYETDWHHHMHFGFDRDLPRGGNPTENLVRYLADLAGLVPGQSGQPGQPGRAGEPAPAPRVLDAGCGVGGSAIWLAREAGCRCVGITLVEAQARLARGFAAARGAAPAAGGDAVRVGGARAETACARFAVNDFTRPAFKAGSFDVVWAVESFDHAPDKEDWLRRMGDLLRPGGRLLIADGFRSEKPLDAAGERAYRRFLAGWAVPHLCTFREMGTWAARAGLEVAHAEDLTADVLPHSRAIFRFGLLFIPFRWLLNRLRLTSDEKLGNAYATWSQYSTLRDGAWTYGVFCLRKPAAGPVPRP
jgi:SAM-dependent methyltransferase